LIEGKKDSKIRVKAKSHVDNNLFWTPHSTYSLENLNDGDPSTINQVEYHGTTGEDMYEDNLLKDSFYIILDLAKVYDLESIEINWYPKGGRCYKYIIAGSIDDSTYTAIANHADNVTEPNAIKDTLNKVTVRYIRIEILGNFRPTDETHSEFFPVSEITVLGALAANQPEPTATPVPGTESQKIDYIPDIQNSEGFENGLVWTSAYPVENINDSFFNNVVQIEYSGWFDDETGKLDEPFYIVLDLQKAYDLDSIDIYWFLKSDKYYMYKISTSMFDDEYVVQIDRSDNTDKGHLMDSFTGVTARYVRIEVLGNYMPSEELSNKYYAVNEINVFGKLSEVQPTQIPATPTITPQVTETPIVTFTPTATQKVNVNENSKGIKPIVIAAVLVIVFAVITVIVVFVVRKNKKGESDKDV
jgi:hypothetical protein